MPHPPHQTCNTCLYFVPAGADASGDCRRYAPLPLPERPGGPDADDGLPLAWTWPEVEGEWWCGEYAPGPVSNVVRRAAPPAAAVVEDDGEIEAAC